MDVNQIIKKASPSVREMSYVIAQYIKVKKGVKVNVQPSMMDMYSGKVDKAYFHAKKYYNNGTNE
jgi:hypothetical protein